MPKKIFLTGATGYIGGDSLYTIANADLDVEITCLVRNSSKGAKIASQYPKVRMVYGDLDSVALIAEEAKNADIVYHFANCDHEASAEAISKGLNARESDSPAFWIHTSGSMIIGWETTKIGCYGTELPRVYNDWDGVGELVTLPDAAAHRVVDKIVLAASKNAPDKIKTAIVCPPTIYGVGRGPGNQDSQQIPGAVDSILKSKKGFLPGYGKSIWHSIHVQDLSDLYLLLGEAAVAGGGKATWNEEGYYLAESGSFKWGDVFTKITKIANQKGLIPSDETPTTTLDELKKIHPYGHLIWATNSRGESVRGKKLLGWEPHRPSLVDELPAAVEIEAKKLGLIEGHAAKVPRDR